MMISKVLSKYQITLPKEAVRALHIEKGAYLRCKVDHGVISLTPVILEDPYSEEEVRLFDRLYNDPKNRSKVYRSKKDAIEHLKRLQ